MAKATASKAAPADKPKRKMSTPEERVAALEAQLAAARERAANKENKQVKILEDKRDALRLRRKGIDEKIEAINAELETLLPDTRPTEDTESGAA